jgi:ABC-2 type transport system permease protein
VTAAGAVAAPPRRTGRLKGLVDLYAVTARAGVLEQFQYRTANYMYMLGMVVEPVVYLVVWSLVAEANGGSIQGFTAGDFAAYYIVWTLVRNMNIVFTPYGWEFRIRQGQLSGMLLRPVHPLHYDIAYFAGWKVVVIVLWVPIALGLSLAFRPTLAPDLAQVATFLVAIWGAYLIRTMLLFILGMVTLWTTRVAALFELYFTAELLLSGRLVPLDLLPGWAVSIADVLPFRWTFGFPIEVLVTDMTGRELLAGLAWQAGWIVATAGAAQLVWRRAVRHYGAVGN